MKRTTLTLLVAMTLLGTGLAQADEAAKPAAAAPAAKPAAPAAMKKAPEEVPAAAPEKAKIDWASMKEPERKKYMKEVVLPAAKKMFGAFDAKKYPRAKVTCHLCHGDGATTGKFTMPNPELPKLPTTGAGFKELGEKKPDMMKFMGTVVKPQIAALLGMAEFTPQNPTGFGCYGCHTKLP
ncbi:MAG TPA: hypothetical protein VGP64_17015 [Polyangia bacterium]|jgi:hypothetical protein